MSTLDVPSSDTAIDTTPYVDFWPSYLPFDEAQALYAQLRDSCSWAQGIVSIAGKQYNERCLSVVMGRHPGAYKYSSRRVTVEPLSPVVADLMERVSAHCGVEFDVVLLNYYRDGKDIISWHSDREAKGTPVASLSLGASRHFRFKWVLPKTDEECKARASYRLHSGDLLLMKGHCQCDLSHTVLAETKVTEGRINITFCQTMTVAK